MQIKIKDGKCFDEMGIPCKFNRFGTGEISGICKCSIYCGCANQSMRFVRETR